METKFAGFVISVFSLLNIFKQVKAILLKSKKKFFNAFKVYVGVNFSVESGSNIWLIQIPTNGKTKTTVPPKY
jgi:hypothetical protein